MPSWVAFFIVNPATSEPDALPTVLGTDKSTPRAIPLTWPVASITTPRPEAISRIRVVIDTVSLYVPGATCTVAPACATFTACWMVAHGAVRVHALLSLPLGAT